MDSNLKTRISVGFCKILYNEMPKKLWSMEHIPIAAKIRREILTEVMSAGMNGIVGAIARRVGMAGRLSEHVFMGRFRYVMGEEILGEVLEGVSDRTRIGLAILHMARETAELFGEVMVELAFDLALTSDDNLGFLGGSQAFILVMTASMLTSTALSESTFGLTKMRRIDWDSWQGKARVGLMMGATALALSQVYMRYLIAAGSAA